MLKYFISVYFKLGLTNRFIVRFFNAHIVLLLPDGGDFEALNCQPIRNIDRSTMLDLPAEPPLLVGVFIASGSCLI